LARPVGGDERIVNLFETLGIDKRRFLPANQLASMDVSLLNKPIDYTSVFEKLVVERRRAMDFLRGGLSIVRKEKLVALQQPVAFWKRCYRFTRRIAGKIKRFLLKSIRK